MRGLAPILSLISLAARRLWNQRLLMACLLLGLVAAVGLLSSIPLYADAAQNRLLQGELESADSASETEAATARPPFSFLWRYIGAWHGNVTWEKYRPVDDYLSEQAPAIVDLPLETQARHVATDKMRLLPSEDAAFVPDEPTGELDTVTGQQILHLFRRIADRDGTTVLIATHDLAVDAFADEVYHLQDGQIVGS